MLQSNGNIDEDVCHKINAGWMKWRKVVVLDGLWLPGKKNQLG
jgi:hypothetical protein